MRFLENFWYAAGWSDEITSAPLARRILDRPVALFRTEGGKAAAFDDCCPHRMVPLSRGRVEGETLRCGYHGLRFDCSGKCVEIPGQASIPPRAKVLSYPLVERWKLAWIWMGDPAKADPALIPELPWLGSPEWVDSHGTHRLRLQLRAAARQPDRSLAHHLRAPAHDRHRRRGKDGGEDHGRCGRVLVERYMNDTEPSIMYRKIGGFTGKVNRWQKIEFTPPTNIVIDAGAVPAGDRRPESRHRHAHHQYHHAADADEHLSLLGLRARLQARRPRHDDAISSTPSRSPSTRTRC